MNSNPIETIKSFIKNGGSPQQIVDKLAEQNPALKNVISIARNGNTQDLENFARNMFKEQGRDFDTEFSEFMRSFK